MKLFIPERILIPACLCLVNGVHSKLFNAVAKPGQVSNHSSPFLVLHTPTTVNCAIECEKRLESGCKSLNVRENKTVGGWSCELFNNRRYKIPDSQWVNSTNGRHFQRVCDGLALKSAARDVNVNASIITMIDVQQNVYQQRDGELPSFVGKAIEVFGINGGQITTAYFRKRESYFVQAGEYLYCFEAQLVDGLQKFKNCSYHFFPLEHNIFFDQPNHTDKIAYVITYDLHKTITFWKHTGELQLSKSSEKSLNSSGFGVKTSNRVEVVISCGDEAAGSVDADYGLCPWYDQWSIASGGMYTSIIQVCFFVQTDCYLLDFDEKTMVAHHPICRDEANPILI